MKLEQSDHHIEIDSLPSGIDECQTVSSGERWLCSWCWWGGHFSERQRQIMKFLAPSLGVESLLAKEGGYQVPSSMINKKWEICPMKYCAFFLPSFIYIVLCM